MWADIRQKIIQVIKDNCDKTDTVSYCDSSKFSNYPAIVVSPSDNEADFSSSQEDQYTFIFNIQVHQLISDAGQEQAEKIVEEILDQLLVVFKDHGILAAACDWTTPAVSQWLYQDREDGQHRVGTIKLKCVKFA